MKKLNLFKRKQKNKEPEKNKPCLVKKEPIKSKKIDDLIEWK